MPEPLTTYGDQNYAIRKAIEKAAELAMNEVYYWSTEMTAIQYKHLLENRFKFDLKLKHPEGIEPN